MKYFMSLMVAVAFPSLAMAQDKMILPENIAQIVTASKPTYKIYDKNYIGDNVTIEANFEDTLLELARKHNLGYVEMIAANPGVDPWLPGEGTDVFLPKKHIIPHGVKRRGIVINLAEMRLYDFETDRSKPHTYPLGVGRDGLNTPTGITTITRKKDGPSWRPTPRMRKEDPTLPEVVGPGDDNPLGTHALYLGWPQYLIHGTHKPLGVGRRVSSGCIRMYPEDIVKVFENIPVGTTVEVIKQPIKLGWIDDMLYLEAHADEDLADTYEATGAIKDYKVPETLFADLSDIAGEHTDRLDWKLIRDAVKHRRGIPVPILTSSKTDMAISKDLLLDENNDDKNANTDKQQRHQSFEFNG